jgi:ADP-dependent phosphofructokinase/glucokinase
MDENKENSRDWLTQLAELTESIDNTFISGHCKVIVELPEKKFRKLQNNFRQIDKFKNESVVSISDIDFTFVLKK